MAIIRAVKTGNWSDSTVWAPSPPTAADDVYSNTFTVTIDVSPTVLQISNALTTGVTAGGGFVISADGITLNCTGAGIVIGANATCLTVNIPSPSVATIVGNCVGGSPSFHCVNNASSGTLNITGNCTGSSGGNAGANNASSGTLNITGNCSGGGGTGNGGPGARNASTGTLNITGNCTGGSVSNSHGALNNTTGTLNITGNCTGGGGSGGNAGAINNSTGTLVHVGSVLASTAAAGISGGSAGQVTILTGPLLSTDGTGALANAAGVNPCTATRWFPADTALATFEYTMRGATVSGSPSARPARRLFLQQAYDSLYPVAGNVRAGTGYGPANIYTGTCAVPPAGSVAFGVPVDATTGTAAIDGASIRSALGLASANLDSQLDALPTAAEAASAVRTELTTELGNLDATVSSRLAASGYTAPPSAASIATAVWAAASRTLTAAIDQSSTIAAAVWSAATRTITGGTVDTLTNAPTVPSAAAIASQVRTELTTELSRIDATVSSRLAPAGTLARVTLVDTTTTLTNAPDVPTEAEIATAVRTELTTELARIDATVSSRLASSGYTAPPSAASIRAEIDANSTKLDASISTRLASSGYTAPLDAAATRSAVGLSSNNLDSQLSGISSGVSSLPSAATVASQVRTELATELGRIDASVSSRLAPSGTLARVTLADTVTTLTNAPDVPTEAEIADAVRVELAPELARVSNCSTVETTGDQLAALQP